MIKALFLVTDAHTTQINGNLNRPALEYEDNRNTDIGRDMF